MKQISINLLPGTQGRIKRKKVEFIFFSFVIMFLTFFPNIFLNTFLAYQVKKCELYKDQLIKKIGTVSSDLKNLNQQSVQLTPRFNHGARK